MLSATRGYVCGYKLEDIEPILNFSWLCFFLLWLLFGEILFTSIDDYFSLSEVAIFINFNLCLWAEPCAETFIISELNALGSFFGALFPLKLSYFGACIEVPNYQIALALNEFLASYKISVTWREIESADLRWFQNESELTSRLTINDMEANGVGYNCIAASKERELSQSCGGVRRESRINN